MPLIIKTMIVFTDKLSPYSKITHLLYHEGGISFWEQDNQLCWVHRQKFVNSSSTETINTLNKSMTINIIAVKECWEFIESISHDDVSPIDVLSNFHL